MAFPTTPVLDDFNRANGALGANWGAPSASGDATPTIFSNAMVAGSGVYGSAYWNPATYLDCEVYATFTHDSACFVWTRIHDANTAGLDVVYSLFHIDTGTIEVLADVNGSNVWAPASITGLTLVSGDQFGMTTQNIADDIVVEVFQNGVSRGVKTLTGGVTTYAATIASAGNIGVALFGGGDTLARSLDNFGGGSLATVSVTATAFAPISSPVRW